MQLPDRHVLEGLGGRLPLETTQHRELDILDRVGCIGQTLPNPGLHQALRDSISRLLRGVLQLADQVLERTFTLGGCCSRHGLSSLFRTSFVACHDPGQGRSSLPTRTAERH